MFRIALRNLVQEKARLIITISGLTFSVMLMVFLQGLSVGYSKMVKRIC